jgi:hypothetical protein
MEWRLEIWKPAAHGDRTFHPLRGGEVLLASIPRLRLPMRTSSWAIIDSSLRQEIRSRLQIERRPRAHSHVERHRDAFFV